MDNTLLNSNFSQSQNMITLKELLSQFQETLAALPISDYQIDLDYDQSFELNSRLGEVESVESQEDFSMTLVLYSGYRSTQVQCYGFDLDSWRQAAEIGCRYLQYTDEDLCLGLSQDYDYRQTIPVLEKFFPTNITRTQWQEKVLSMENLALEQEDIINSEGSYGQLSYTLSGQLNSRGLSLYLPQSYYSIGLTVVAGEGAHQQQVDGSFAGSLQLELLPQPEEIANKAVHRARAKLNPRCVAAGKYPIIFSPHISSHLIKSLLRALSGTAQYKKATFLLDSLEGDLVMPQWCTLEHCPYKPEAHYSYPIDADGLLGQSTVIVDKGRVCEYILSLYSARRLSLPANHLAGGVRNLTMTTNAKDLEEILTHFDEALVIEAVLGTGINLVNGDYSMGVNGFYYQGAERQYSLKETTIAGNLKKILKGIVFHGQDALVYKNLQIGTLAIDEMSVSGH